MGRKATRSAEEIAKAKRDMFIRTAEKRVGRILDGLDIPTFMTAPTELCSMR